MHVSISRIPSGQGDTTVEATHTCTLVFHFIPLGPGEQTKYHYFNATTRALYAVVLCLLKRIALKATEGEDFA